jgi:hypothetical protein
MSSPDYVPKRFFLPLHRLNTGKPVKGYGQSRGKFNGSRIGLQAEVLIPRFRNYSERGMADKNQGSEGKTC